MPTVQRRPYTPGQYFNEELGYPWLYVSLPKWELYYKTIYDPVTYDGFSQDLSEDKTDAIIDPESFRAISSLKQLFNPDFDLWLNLSKAKYQDATDQKTH